MIREVAFSRISSDQAYKKHWRKHVGADMVPHVEDFTIGVDTFYNSEYNLLGIAYSIQWYHAYSLRQDYVKLAFDTIRTNLIIYPPSTQSDNIFLQELLLKVQQAFAGLRIPDEKLHEIPVVHLKLANLQGETLFIEGANSIDVYLANENEVQQVNRQKVTIESGNLIVIVTNSMAEVMLEANLCQFAGCGRCNAKAVNQHLIDVLKSQPGDIDDPPGTPRPGRLTDYDIRSRGAAWAIACVGDKK